MTETKVPYTVDTTTTDLVRLAEILGMEYVRLLAQILVEVKSETG